MGTHDSGKPNDYPDYAVFVEHALRAGNAEGGLLVCGSGVGVSVAANRFKCIRAGLCHDHYSAHQGVENDDMNVLVVGGRIIGQMMAKDVTAAFLGTQFSGEERHVRRFQQSEKD